MSQDQHLMQVWMQKDEKTFFMFLKQPYRGYLVLSGGYSPTDGTVLETFRYRQRAVNAFFRQVRIKQREGFLFAAPESVAA